MRILKTIYNLQMKLSSYKEMVKMICRECGMELKENSKKCTNCGSTNLKDDKSSTSFRLFILLIIFVVVFVIAVVAINNQQDRANMRRLEYAMPKSSNSTK